MVNKKKQKQLDNLDINLKIKSPQKVVTLFTVSIPST